MDVAYAKLVWDAPWSREQLFPHPRVSHMANVRDSFCAMIHTIVVATMS